MIIFYLLILTTALTAIFARYKSQKLYLAAKALPLIIIIFMVISYSNTQLLFIRLIILGLFFGLLGDIALLFKKLFYLGLIFFLIGHIFYATTFLNYSPILNWILVLPFIFYAVYFYKILQLKDRKKSFAIIFYIIAISIMGFAALNLFLTEISTASSLMFMGAILFIISDSILAFNKFKQSFHSAQFYILTSYYLAQTLTATGAILLCV